MPPLYVAYSFSRWHIFRYPQTNLKLWNRYLFYHINKWTSNLVYQFGKINILVAMLTYIRFIKNTVACKKLVTVIWFTANMFSSTHKQRRSLQKNYRISLIVEWHCKMPKCLITVPWLDYQKNCSCLSVQGHDFFPVNNHALDFLEV